MPWSSPGDPLRARLVTRFEAELLAALGRRERTSAQTRDDLAGTFGQRAVRGMDALVEPDVVLETDADVAAQEHRLRHHRHLHAADAEAGPERALREIVDHRLHGGGVGFGTPGNAEAKLEQRRTLEQAFLHHLLGEPEMAGVEDLELRLHAELLHALGAGAQ